MFYKFILRMIDATWIGERFFMCFLLQSALGRFNTTMYRYPDRLHRVDQWPMMKEPRVCLLYRYGKAEMLGKGMM